MTYRGLLFCSSLLLLACGESSTDAAPSPSTSDGGQDAGSDGPVEPGDPEAFGVLTFNVLCSFCDPTYDPWDERLGYFDDIFARHDPDLIGLQEPALSVEVDALLGLLPGYEVLFYQAEESNFSYPDSALLYRSERFELISEGEYWLSPTPEVPSSTGFAENMQLPRLVTWAELRDKRTQRLLYFANTHVDNNTPSQELSAPLILERAAPWGEKMPVLVVGDFNSKPTSPAYQLLTGGAGGHPGLTNAQDLAESWSVTHNQPAEPAYELDDRIDHIFVAPQPENWQVQRWEADLYVYGDEDKYPSDHWPIFARVLAPEM